MPPTKFSFHRFRKLRFYLAWLFVIALAVFARSTPRGFWIGIPIILIGEAVRIWSHGYLRKIRRLATSGPYAYIRNPLYAGNFLIGSGFCLIIWHPIVEVVFVVGFFLIYWVTIKGEEEKLASKFGEAYADYVRHVPRFMPRFTPYRRQLNAKFRFYRTWNHGEHITILAMVALLLVLYLRQELYQAGHPLTGTTLWIIALTIILAVGIVLAMTARYGYQPSRFMPLWPWLFDIAKWTRRWRNWQTRKT